MMYGPLVSILDIATSFHTMFVASNHSIRRLFSVTFCVSITDISRLDDSTDANFMVEFVYVMLLSDACVSNDIEMNIPELEP